MGVFTHLVQGTDVYEENRRERQATGPTLWGGGSYLAHEVPLSSISVDIHINRNIKVSIRISNTKLGSATRDLSPC